MPIIKTITCLITKIVCFNILLLAIWGCQSNNQDSANSGQTLSQKKEVITIKFIGQWLNEGLREDLVRNFVREYEFTHQEVSIELKFPEEIYYDRNDNLSNQKFVASIIKNDKPEWDIIRINNEYQAIDDITGDVEWAKKSLVDFSEIEEYRKNTLPELLTDSVKKLWHGIIPGPFIEGVNWALWCNNNVAKKMGIKVKQFDMTFDDLVGYIKAADEYNKTHKDYIIPVFEANDWRTTVALSIQLYASELNDKGDFYADKVSEKKIKAWEKTLKSIELLTQHNAFSDRIDTMHWEKGKNLILADKCLFFSNGSWMYNIWQKYNKEKLKDIMPVEYPVYRTTNIYLGGYQIMWGVLKNSAHREEAIKVLLTLNSSALADQWERYTKCPTGIKGSFSSTSFGKDQFSLYTQHITEKYGTNKNPLADNCQYILGYSRKNISNHHFDIITKKMTADEAIKDIRKKAGR